MGTQVSRIPLPWPISSKFGLGQIRTHGLKHVSTKLSGFLPTGIQGILYKIYILSCGCPGTLLKSIIFYFKKYKA